MEKEATRANEGTYSPSTVKVASSSCDVFPRSPIIPPLLKLQRSRVSSIRSKGELRPELDLPSLPYSHDTAPSQLISTSPHVHILYRVTHSLEELRGKESAPSREH